MQSRSTTIAYFESAIMKFSVGLLLPVLISAARTAASDGTVYIFQGQESPSSSSNPPALTPEEARLVFAQRLGISQYHGIGDASEKTLSSINTFSGRQESIFQDSGRDKAAELVLLVQGFSSKTAQPLIDAWSSYKPVFTISDAPSAKLNLRLIEDLQRQVGTVQDCVLEENVNPFNDKCWNGKAKAIFMDLTTGKVQNRKQFRCFARANSFQSGSRNQGFDGSSRKIDRIREKQRDECDGCTYAGIWHFEEFEAIRIIRNAIANPSPSKTS